MPVIRETKNVIEIRKILVTRYGFTPDEARYVVKFTADDVRRPAKEWKVPDADGFITLRYVALSRFELEDHTEKKSGKGVAIPARQEYTRGSKAKMPHPRRDSPMPAARGRRSAPVAPPEPEPEENGQVDFQKYLDKDLSPTMADYVTWFEDNVAALEDVPIDKLLALGSSLYPHFQKSEFNISRRDARRGERAARESEPEPEPEPEPAPVRRGRGRPPKAAAAPPPPAPAPARRGRGRPPKAAATAEAPY
jgi:hypothetical protein